MKKLKLQYLYFIIFGIIILYLGVYIFTYYNENTPINITSAKFSGAECKLKTPELDVTNAVAEKCNSLQSCTYKLDFVELDATCRDLQTVKWNCSDNPFLKASYKYVYPGNPSSGEVTISCPGRSFTTKLLWR